MRRCYGENGLRIVSEESTVFKKRMIKSFRQPGKRKDSGFRLALSCEICYKGKKIREFPNTNPLFLQLTGKAKADGILTDKKSGVANVF